MSRASWVVGILLAVGCAADETADDTGLPFYRSADLTPEWLEPERVRSPDMHRIGDFELTDQRHATVSRADVDGRVFVANFFYTSCTQICPNMQAQMGRIADALGDRVILLSHSITPEQDSVGALAKYAAAQGITDRGWHLLTGDPDRIRALAESSYFVELDDPTGNTRGDLLHTETLVLVDRDGHIRGVYNGTLPFEVDRLVEDARALLDA